MTRDEFIDYWKTWLRRAGRTSVDADYRQGIVRMRTPREQFSGYVQPCNCDREDCLGWVVMTVKEKLPEKPQ